MATSVFNIPYFTPPYTDVTFPGKSEDENILYITRESPLILGFRLTIFSFVAAIVMLSGALIMAWLATTANINLDLLIVLILLFGFLAMAGGFWWIWTVYRKTLFIITTRRLTKFIHVTPWNRYQMSLTLDKVVDSGSYSKGYFQALFGLGTFVARSSAGNVKNFKIVNIHYSEDLHNWMNKLIFVFNKDSVKLDAFRPFVPKPSGQRY